MILSDIGDDKQTLFSHRPFPSIIVKMMNRFFLTVCSLFLVALFLPADEIRTVGGSAGWSDLMRVSRVGLEEGKKGLQELVLEERQYEGAKPDVDLLLHFDRSPFLDAAGTYRIDDSHSVRRTKKGRFGGGAAKFKKNEGGIHLIPKDGALFGEQTLRHSFSMEFWLYPLHLDDGESLIHWEGHNTIGETLHLQEIDASIEERKLRWNFSNIFFSSDFEPRTVSLSGRTPLVPREWHHHLIRFDAQTGLLEYLVDGKPEAVRYVTDSGKVEGSVLRPYIGESSRKQLVIGSDFNGYMDELRVLRDVVESPLLTPYSYTLGWTETTHIDLGDPGTEIHSISADESTPPETDIFYFYRLYDNREDAIRGDGEWVRFTPGRSFSPPLSARFLQLRFELYPDGEGRRTPAVSKVDIAYTPNLSPLSPRYVDADPGDGSVTLSWQPTTEGDTAGYLLYYGTKPERYRGDDASAGTSPIDVGDTTEVLLEGLENGKIYYFAVAAYDKVGRENRGPLSDEVSARPSGSRPYEEESE